MTYFTPPPHLAVPVQLHLPSCPHLHPPFQPSQPPACVDSLLRSCLATPGPAAWSPLCTCITPGSIQTLLLFGVLESPSQAPTLACILCTLLLALPYCHASRSVDNWSVSLSVRSSCASCPSALPKPSPAGCSRGRGGVGKEHNLLFF